MNKFKNNFINLNNIVKIKENKIILNVLKIINVNFIKIMMILKHIIVINLWFYINDYKLYIWL